MSTSICHDDCKAVSPPKSAYPAFAKSAFDGLLRLWKARRHRAQVARLTQVDERMLADIGLTSSDVRMAMAAPFGEDPSMTLLRLAGERRVAHREAMRQSASELSRSTVLVSLGWSAPRDRRRGR